MYNKIRIMNDV